MYPDSNLEAKLNINQQVKVNHLAKGDNTSRELNKGVEPFMAVKHTWGKFGERRIFNEKSPNKKQRNVSFSYLDNLVGIREVFNVISQNQNYRGY